MSTRSVRPHEHAYYSAGRWLLNQLYVIGWPDLEIIKVGTTSVGRRRYGPFLARGGEMLSLASYPSCEHLDEESRLQSEMRARWPPAFSSKVDASSALGGHGGGYLECFRVPLSDWPEVVGLLRGVKNGET